MCWFILLFSLAHTIPELIKSPESFYQQSVTVIGEVSDVVTRYGENPYTTFMLRDEEDITLPVFVWGTPTFKQGQVCQVAGTFVTEKVLGAYALRKGIEAAKVEKTSTEENRTVSAIFKKKKKFGHSWCTRVLYPTVKVSSAPLMAYGRAIALGLHTRVVEAPRLYEKISHYHITCFFRRSDSVADPTRSQSPPLLPVALF